MGYRRDVESDVLDPFIQVAEHKEPAAAIGRIFAEVYQEATSACEALPEQVGIPWSPKALTVAESDGVGRKLGKVVARVVSQARHSGGERPVPIRALARRHLESNVAPRQGAAAQEAIRLWAVWWTRLESAWADWARATLPVLMAMEGLDDEDDPGGVDSWNVVSSAASTLDAALEELSECTPHEPLVAQTIGAVDKARGVLEADLSVAGSFHLGLGKGSTSTVAERVRGTAEGWAAWQHQSLARLRLQSAVLAVSSGAAGVQQRLVARIEAACLGSVPRLVTLSQQLAGLAVEVRSASSGLLTGRLAETCNRAEAALTDALGAVPDESDIEAAVRDGAETTVDALQAMVRHVPPELALHSLVRAPPRRSRSIVTRSVGLQRMAREAFDALRVERIRSAVLGMLETFELAGQSVAELPEVVAFGFNAALQEAESDEQGADERAVELAAEALDRAAEALHDLPRALEDAIRGGAEGAADEISKGCAGFAERVESTRVEAQLLAARSRFANLRVRLVTALGPRTEHWAMALRLAWTRTRRGATLLLRRGSALVGSEPTAHERSARTVRALASADELMQSLPLVYQRLFSFEPLSDPALMAGREREIEEALARWSRWQAVDGIALLVRGRAGSGVTSFLNALIDKLRTAGADVVGLTFRRRLTEERELASRLASTLGLEAVATMDDLARSVLRAPEGTIPNAVVLDELEHLYLRVPGGTALLERLLTFMSETEPRVFWVGGMSASAWQLVDKVEPTAGAQVDGLDLGLLTAEACRQLVTLRHKRSGLHVRYEEPREGRHLLKRRLRRLRGTRTHQEILETDFFERLHRVSLGHVNLALFQWLVAADFDSRDGEVYMHPVAPPDFSVLDSLSLAQNFTLKALIEHRSLTLEQHDAIFRIPRRESYQILESLENRHLIEPIGQRDQDQAESEFKIDLRYRVLPLLTGAVISHLQARNIIH